MKRYPRESPPGVRSDFPRDQRGVESALAGNSTGKLHGKTVHTCAAAGDLAPTASDALAETVSLSNFIQVFGQQARIQILLVIARQEACVCHIEAVLGLRQASISQHLMVLREAGLVAAQREGRNIFYRLTRPELLDILQQVAVLAGLDVERLASISQKPIPGCPCPHCNPGSVVRC